MEKEKKFVSETREKELAEERAKVGKAKPSPCTTDYPMVDKNSLIHFYF